MIHDESANPLGFERITALLPRFAIPSIIGMLTGALYNIVDQIFIGINVGIMGVAATNIDLPIATASLSVALLFGIGGAASFSLSLGSGQTEKATRIVGNSLFWTALIGVLMTAGVSLFLQPLVTALGATPEVLPYSVTYSGIVALGLPFAMLSIGMSHLIRADGSPGISMLCTVIGCLVNVCMDAVLMFGFGLGVAGAAWATVTAQFVSFVLCSAYMLRFKHAKLSRASFVPSPAVTLGIMAIGMSSFFTQLAISVVQTVLNNTLTHYGALSSYGSEIPLAAVGVIIRINMISMSVVVGVAQGCQPIIGYNFGAKNYGRVRATFKLAVILAFIISLSAYIIYQVFPRQIAGVFGSGDPLFVEFSTHFFRTFLMLGFLTGFQPLVGNFFTSIGRAIMGAFISLTRQFLFFLPLVVLFPMLWGLDGVLYAGPVADGTTFALSALLIWRELHTIKRMENETVNERNAAIHD